MTEEECTALFDQDLAKVMQNLQPTISGFRYMSDCHRAALINLCFNLGISGLGKFTKQIG
jgi:GH24 family phage-related lysozyme (muramidase)